MLVPENRNSDHHFMQQVPPFVANISRSQLRFRSSNSNHPLSRHIADKLDILAPMMAVAAPTPRNKIGGNGIVDGFHFSRAGIADGRNGQGSRR